MSQSAELPRQIALGWRHGVAKIIAVSSAAILVLAVLATRTPVDLSRTPWPDVRRAAAEHDIQLVTVDRVEGAAAAAAVIADDWTKDVERLVARGATAAVLLSFEPPITAWRLYYNLERVSAQFAHSFLYEGARERVAPTTWFHPLYSPVPCPPPRPTGLPWPSRRFMAAICDYAEPPEPRNLVRTLAGLRYRPIARHRYTARLSAFEAFSKHEDFDLYGRGWDSHEPIAAAHRGAASDPLSLLARYRFALVYESARFNGYITDTILNCFFARCVPIYSGAPDIAQYIPPSAFIDVRQFQSFPELERFLERTTEDDARRYVDAARAFMISPHFERWCAERFARDLVEALVSVGGVQQGTS